MVSYSFIQLFPKLKGIREQRLSFFGAANYKTTMKGEESETNVQISMCCDGHDDDDVSSASWEMQGAAVLRECCTMPERMQSLCNRCVQTAVQNRRAHSDGTRNGDRDAQTKVYRVPT